MIGVIITAHNEGKEVGNTIHSVVANTDDCKVILVDEASTDGSCDGHPVDFLIRHKERIGIAYSRNIGVAKAKEIGCDTFAFLDAHQRVSPRCLNQCADVAKDMHAVVWPCLTGLVDKDRNWRGHGANMRLIEEDKTKRWLFSLQWKKRRGLMYPAEAGDVCASPNGREYEVSADDIPIAHRLSPSSTMVVPGYVMDEVAYSKVRWISQLRGWGASEPAVTVKCFFTETPCLHLCGPLARHYFRPGKRIPYPTAWKSVARNHALVARICFSDRTWRKFWRPKAFKRWLHQDIAEFDRDPIVSEHEAFQSIKRRSDDQFFREVLHMEPPEGVSS